MSSSWRDDSLMQAAAPDAAVQAWLDEAVRLLEARGPLEDSDAMRQAAAQAAHGASHRQQIATRSAVLGHRLGLQAALARLRHVAPWALLLMALLMGLAGVLLAGAVVDVQDRRINVLGALVALLGAHAITFLLWLLALLWPGADGGGVARLWAQLTAKLALGRGAEPQALLQGGLRLLARARLLPWVGGLASHTLWTLTLLAAIAALLFALSFKRFTLGWESTLLTPDTLAQAVRTLGLLPGWLGFSVPDAALLQTQQAAPSAERDRQLAWWLIGCVTVYGLAPRLIALAACQWVWRLRRPRLAPDLGEPYYRQLIARLDALAPPTVIDADTVRHDWELTRRSLAAQTRDGWAVLGFELPPEQPWPPAPLPAPLLLVLRIDGSAGERQQVLMQLAELRPRMLVLAVHAQSSPDRGTERFLRELLPVCGQCRLWLAAAPWDEGEPAQDSPGAARWRRWLAEHDLNEVHAHASWRQASHDPMHPATPAVQA
ncbi:DUF2868 domain-containing protein [Xenophilus arseniciresistens]|uniref:DUF2868 domain-containing protein n=1 Tax=Xenophilus arseniciresistens TaxID=1283306 RepID=A0AAE3SX62_9BURK|nr:DUF2868 domain-containing protein [Xenophilus arseniciresistens]MDA7414812.1 DUF2868 domain-containing protein [Xenophilus arseniciresistens]